MITNEIIKIASNTSNVGLTNKYTFKASKKNSLCGDMIKVEIIAKNSIINSMKYETESCVYCEASASLLAKVIKNKKLNITKKELKKIKELPLMHINEKFPKKFSKFKSLINKNNLNRLNCIFLPFDAVLKALR